MAFMPANNSVSWKPESQDPNSIIHSVLLSYWYINISESELI